MSTARSEEGKLATLRDEVELLARSLEQMREQIAQHSEALARLAMPAPSQSQAQAEKKRATPEMLVVIAAAITSFLGKKVRIRSARLAHPPYEVMNSWAQQGRVSVQASHTLAELVRRQG